MQIRLLSPYPEIRSNLPDPTYPVPDNSHTGMVANCARDNFTPDPNSVSFIPVMISLLYTNLAASQYQSPSFTSTNGRYTFDKSSDGVGSSAESSGGSGLFGELSASFFVTVNLQVAFFPLSVVAVIIASPGIPALMKPFFTAAILPSLISHVTCVVAPCGSILYSSEKV